MNAAAIILAGGRGQRLGGLHKPALEVGGSTLIARSVAAVRLAGCSPIVAVGPAMSAEGIDAWVREDPPLGGPAAALGAAVAFLGPASPAWAIVLAADLVQPGLAIEALSSAELAADGAYLVDEDGREQWLAAIYRVDALRRVLDGAQTDGASIRSVIGALDLAAVPARHAAIADIDTWEDLEHARDQSTWT